MESKHVVSDCLVDTGAAASILGTKHFSELYGGNLPPLKPSQWFGLNPKGKWRTNAYAGNPTDRHCDR